MTPNLTDTVTIDGVEFYVIAKDETENKALLLSKYLVEKRVFNGTTIYRWEDSQLRSYLNTVEDGGWLNDKPTLAAVAAETTVYTLKSYSSSEFISTNDKIFVLSEADLFATSNNVDLPAGADSRYYTTGRHIELFPDKASRKAFYSGDTTGSYWWLRSPVNNGIACVNHAGNYGKYTSTSSIGVRPALWISLG